MKYIIAIIVSIGIINSAFAEENHTEEAKNKAEEYIKACKTETGISDENADKIKAGDFSVRDEKAQVSVKSVNKLIECLLKMLFRKLSKLTICLKS